MLKIFLSILFTLSILNANDFKQQSLTITNTNEKTADINVGSLQIGQSGIIIHNFSKNKSIILKKASVISSNKNNSKILFSDEDVLKQDSIANTNLTPKNGDTFILNHMYNVSLLIAPNFKAYRDITNTHNNNFIDSELFAAYLKINDIASPTEDDIKLFTKLNNISTIYLVIKNTLHILDASTFKVIKTKEILINDDTTQVPFYTNIKDIKTSFFDFTNLAKIKNYDKYYKKLIRNK